MNSHINNKQVGDTIQLLECLTRSNALFGMKVLGYIMNIKVSGETLILDESCKKLQGSRLIEMTCPSGYDSDSECHLTGTYIIGTLLTSAKNCNKLTSYKRFQSSGSFCFYLLIDNHQSVPVSQVMKVHQNIWNVDN